ncbi:MAG: hypothetical protein K0S53_625 [Bacteroidetes bacterium]|jgi:hypothetical protein|nr:hypothetical protein [Bacteroidota bacterium]MDF2451622.1 hypothetical protein [Bacteroidota bacterium]
MKLDTKHVHGLTCIKKQGTISYTFRMSCFTDILDWNLILLKPSMMLQIVAVTYCSLA